MKVNLLENQNVVFKGVESRNGKNGVFQLVVLADMDNIEKFDFFLRDELKLDGLIQGDNVSATFEVSRRGYNTNIDLVSLKKLTK